jgi:hypothetical protein
MDAKQTRNYEVAWHLTRTSGTNRGHTNQVRAPALDGNLEVYGYRLGSSFAVRQCGHGNSGLNIICFSLPKLAIITNYFNERTMNA